MDKTEPFLYYLASKYQNRREWDQHEIRFSVNVLNLNCDWARKCLFVNNYKITSCPATKKLEIIEKERSEIETLPAECPFLSRTFVKTFDF